MQTTHFWIYHGLIMWFVYNVLMLVQIVSHRFLRHEWKLAIKLHVVTAVTMVFLSALGFYFMFAYLGNEVAVFKWGKIHVILGFSTFATLAITIAFGLCAYSKRVQTESNWQATQLIR